MEEVTTLVLEYRYSPLKTEKVFHENVAEGTNRGVVETLSPSFSSIATS